MTTARRSLSNWLSGWSQWRDNRKATAAQRPPSDDYADYGTAFGLDLSMGHHSGDTSARPATGPNSTASTTTPKR